MRRHGLNLRANRGLWPFPTEGGIHEIDVALRREVRAVDALDQAALAAMGVTQLGRDIEQMLVAASVGPIGEVRKRNLATGQRTVTGKERRPSSVGALLRR